MVSSGGVPRVRKQPEERRAEILAEAARIALEEGLERITLRAVADGLGVRPGLISHYFPAAEDLVVAAFLVAVSGERERLQTGEGEPLERLAAFVRRIESESVDLARLWLNARHLARFTPALADAIEEQEALDRERLISLIDEGCDAGVFEVEDPLAACVRIFMAVDGFGAYANNAAPFEPDAYAHFVTDVSEWALGLSAGALRSVGTWEADPVP
ncbi:TetR/AcrR family transcriptional regulator [Leucobacter sp. CSA1]|uniref:TetR/AcrR family transcriptional regulator n=1 Tax=Leucobacter chromiisoli TaxID=2796471 RepID=A0A934UUD7_9MICO|nr:TetR/AcrR family transcriptional regulator [Leucobacter chromiisoli]MBK0419374.1 TetR/AcrR family transcriptional regulator [Leucobacter chromiisoli]